MEFIVHDLQDKQVGTVDIASAVILDEPNQQLVYELLKVQQTRKCRTASTKTRAEVRGGGRKPWKQKGTGRARAGSLRSPLFVGGGVIFGPRPHLISIDMPKRARKKALCSALSLKKDELKVIDSFPAMTSPKTTEALKLVDDFKFNDKKLLLIIEQHTIDGLNIMKSFSNIPKCKIIHWQNLNIHDLVNAEAIIIEKDILKKIEAWLITYTSKKGAANV